MTGPIVGIGGGGFLMDDTRGLQERYLLSLLPAARSMRPRVLYLGTASGDGERAQLKFMQAFSALGCMPSTLPFFPYAMARDYAAEVEAADLVYVGGGNTVAMLAVWREFGFDAALRRAREHGTLLAGISAGANCWFEQYVTDSVPGGGIRAGLGWLPGTFCPHLDSESWRAAVFDAAPALPAYGAPEGAMLRFDVAGACVEAVTSIAGATASVREAGAAAARALPTRPLPAA